MVHSGFEHIPHIRLHWERGVHIVALIIRRDGNRIFIPFQGDEVALIDHADFGFEAAAAVGQHIGLQGVIFGFFGADEGHGALEENLIEGFGKGLGFDGWVFRVGPLADLPFEARTHPWQRRVGESGTGFGGVNFFSVKAFEIFGLGGGGHDAAANHAGEAVRAGRFKSTSADFFAGDERASGIKGGIGGGFDAGGGWDVAFPFHVARLAGDQTFAVERLNPERGFFAWGEGHFLGNDAQSSGGAGFEGFFFRGRLGGNFTIGDVEAIELVAGRDVEQAIGHGRLGIAFAIHFHRLHGFGAIAGEFEDVEETGHSATFAGAAFYWAIKVAIDVKRRRMQAALGNFLFKDKRAGFDVDADELSGLGDLIDAIADHGGAGGERAIGMAPCFGGGWKRGAVGFGGVCLFGRDFFGEAHADEAADF